MNVLKKSYKDSAISLHDSAEYFEFSASRVLQRSSRHQGEFKAKGLDYFSYFFLPAAGPKAFVSCGFEYSLRAMDKTIQSPKWFIGGSTGALRAFAYVSGLVQDKDITLALKEHYCQMYYQKGCTSDDLHSMMEQLYQTCAPSESLRQVVYHPTYRIAVIVTQLHPFLEKLPAFLLKFSFAVLALVNLLLPNFIYLFCKRICFYTGYMPPDCLVDDPSVDFCPLTPENAHQVLHATTSIPFISTPCTFIHGKGKGLFHDGGITDYMLNTCVKPHHEPGIVLGDTPPLFPVYRNIFDQMLPWHRHLPRHYFEHTSIVRPSSHFLTAFPEKKLPSVSDWFHPEYIADPEKRRDFWGRVYQLSQLHWHKSLRQY
ncbi:hypothetical protein HDU91_004675 [Kappamyces sp. JEL0680]|nr:hypothetical protein HDU91_004675 [Kappamyces sp. JEL0680]